MLLNDIWPEDDQNVVTKKDPSGPWSDAANLQWAKHGDSRRRNAELARVALVRSVLGDDGPDLGDRLRLNAPCPNGHLWNGHQLGLQKRWGQSWRCDECSKDRSSEDQEKRKERNKKRYQEKIEEEREKARQRMALLRQDPEYRAIANERNKKCVIRQRRTIGRVSRTGLLFPPNLLGHRLQSKDLQVFVDSGWDLSAMDPATVSESHILWFHLKNATPAPTVAELVKKQAQDVLNKEKEEFLENGGTEEEWAREKSLRYYHLKMQTDPDYCLQMRERSRKRKVRIRSARRQALQPVTRQQIDARFALWNYRCAFCGVDASHQRNKGHDRLTIEHVLALTKGGLDEASNILPACLTCNLGKHNAPVEAWYRRQPFFTEPRWRKIQRHCPAAVVGQLPLALL
jgi:hypothetical protein